ncbi:PAS domain-containing sensor histidine kinase [Pontibacter harenae]|uniref:PAS domain-containing sensor histidine kinase n=1 Tax=Pontibacter harenae TaxID=2894083 RepID=UPI001E3FE709|nr:PAS domain-containing protein [Pontibacter harenae]MCC9168616.1 PAS domain-containing protein [Pontibacter harenae]
MTQKQPFSPHKSSDQEALPFQKIFESQPGLLLVLSPELIIKAATDAYLQETLTVREEIVGRHVFDVFPDNPDLPGASSSNNLRASIQEVLASGKPHKMEVFQYDIPSPDEPGKFLERYWSTTNTPMLDEQGNVYCLIHETVNVTEGEKAKRQLKESQEREVYALAMAEQQRLRLERLFEQAPAAFAILEGPELIYKVLNDAYQQLFPGRMLQGLPLFEALPELKDQPIADIIHNVYNTGETFEGKEVLIPIARYQGQPVEDIYWNFIYQAVFNAQRQVSGILIFALDVTDFVQTRRQLEMSAEALKALNHDLEQRVTRRTSELKLAQAEAEQQKDLLHSLFMQAPVGIGIYRGKDHTVELVNPMLSNILGREADDLLHKPVVEVLPEMMGQGIETILDEVYQKGVYYERDEIPAIVERKREQVQGYFHTLYQPLRDAKQEIYSVLQVVYDVTEQVKARKAVEESSSQFLFMANAMPQKVWMSKANGDADYFNQKWLDYTGLSTDELKGWGWSSMIHPDDLEENKKRWQHSVATGERYELEQRIKRKDGEYRWHLSRALAHRDDQDAIIMWVGTSTDIHDNKLAEKELKYLTQELTAANASVQASNEHLEAVNKQLTHINSDLDNFIYTASHDLRAPITNIERLMEELFLELPEESLRQTNVELIIDMMQGAVDRFKKTITNLTEITKLQKEENTAETKIKVLAVVEEVLLDMEHLIYESGTQVEKELRYCSAVSFSEKNMRSIVYNLFSNAIKYSHPDRVPVVKVGCNEEGEFLVLTVKDNGLGMNESQQEKLFSMFRRFHDHVEGSGVGLYMVKRIVDNAGGKIEVESELGEGTMFRVYFRKGP